MSATLDRIAKLLRQAESTKGAESEAFMTMAQKLATQASIDLAVARSHQSKKEERKVPIQKIIRTGQKGKHGLTEFVELALAIARANDVKCNIAHNSTYVVAFGFESDIEVVEALFASLMFQMEVTCKDFIKSGSFKGEMIYTYSGVKPLHGSTARKNFQQSFVSAVGSRLMAAKTQARNEALASSAKSENVDDASSSVALVLVSKEVEVRDFYKSNSIARGSWKGSSSTTYSASSYQAGRQAGLSANLGGQKMIGGSRVGIAASGR